MKKLKEKEEAELNLKKELLRSELKRLVQFNNGLISVKLIRTKGKEMKKRKEKI